MEVIKVIDFAIMKKQHVDNPEYLDNFSIWSQYMPLNDKSEIERSNIMAGLDRKDPLKVLWIYWTQIKRNIEETTKDFTKLPHEKRLAIIDKEVQSIIAKMPQEQLPRIDLNTV
jgi:hypothetical protein